MIKEKKVCIEQKTTMLSHDFDDDDFINLKNKRKHGLQNPETKKRKNLQNYQLEIQML